MSSVKETLLMALRTYRGDDLERAMSAFGGLSDDEMGLQYGKSGKTCLEILEGYRTHRDEVVLAQDFVNREVA